MNEPDDNALLREYIMHGTEEAFARIVARYVNMVYSVALRRTRNPHQAEEITQAVFVTLARKCRRLGDRVVLSGWLYQTARWTAETFLRSEIRRARRQQEASMQTALNQTESEAWPQIAPLLDTAMGRLSENERQAVLLRYFDGKSMKEVASALGSSEDAAKMRVSRAVEKMRGFFAKCGVVIPAAALTAVLAANSVQAAPPFLAKVATAAAIAEFATASGSTITLIHGALNSMIASTRTLVGVATIAGIALPLVVQHLAQGKVQASNDTFQLRENRLQDLRREHDRLSTELANSALSQDQLDSLRKLREEVPELRQQARAVTRLQEENSRLKSKAAGDPRSPLQLKERTLAKLGYSKGWVLGFQLYAEKHDGQFPTNFEQASAFLPDSARNQADVSTNQFEIVFQGSLSSIEKPQDTIVLRETDPWNAGETSHPHDQWGKIYAFADGHVEVHLQPGNNFDEYERQHTVPPPNPSR